MALDDVTPNRETIRFLRALFEKKPPDTFILIWSLQDRRSHFAATVENDPRGAVGAAAWATQAADASRDVYCGVGLAPRPFHKTKRCPADEVAGIVGLWLDVDVADPVHKKKNLPDSTDAALELVDELVPEVPSLVVHSGHGLQPWWLFDEPWIFDDDDERRKAQAYVRAFQTDFITRSKLSHGFDLDSTHDLARVMRVPGTTNRKGEPVPVRLIEP